MNKKMIAPSILSADFAQLGAEVREVEAGGADWIHVDVMDGHFVPNITMGPVVVQALKKVTQLPLDCHLMVTDPQKWIEPFSKAGAYSITIHIEAINNARDLLTLIRAQGCKAGISLNPATPVSEIVKVLDLVDLVLVMSVVPGFGGQSFMENSIPKVEELKRLRKTSAGKYKYLIEIDGGVDATNVEKLSRAGVDVFVAGSAIFKEKNRKATIEVLRKKML